MVQTVVPLFQIDKKRLNKLCDEFIDEITISDLDHIKDWWSELINNKEYYKSDAVEYVFKVISNSEFASDKIKETANYKLRSIYWEKQLKGVI